MKATSAALVALGLQMISPVPVGAQELAGLRYRELVTGGASVDELLPLVVALHPLGAGPRGVEGRVVRALEDAGVGPVRIVSPRGPARWERGRSWFDALAADPDPTLAAALRPAAAQLAIFVDSIRERRPSRGRPIVIGYSQGGLVALALAAGHPASVGEVLAIGATLPRPLWPRERDGALPRVWAWHGAADPYVPLSRTRRALRAFARTGYDAVFVVEPGVGHTFAGPAHRALVAWLGATPALMDPRSADP